MRRCSLFHSNVDPALVSTITDAQGDGASSKAAYRVMLVGNAPHLSHADQGSGIAQRDSLDTVDGQSVTVTAAQAARLSDQPGVHHVTANAPMAPTGAGSASAPVASSSLLALHPRLDGVNATAACD
jgi:hypothetical protein